MNSTSSFLEPFGHEDQLSKIERVWEKRSPGCTVRRRRVSSFDIYSGVSFAPMEYSFERIDYSGVPEPTKEWIEEAFLSFVKGEFESGRGDPDVPRFPSVVAEKEARDGLLEEYMASCERQLLYGFSQSLTKRTDENVAENVRRIFMDKNLGNKHNEKNIDVASLDHTITTLAQDEGRLLCVLPSFPFRDQNYLRTHRAEPWEFGFGEAALLMRLHLISLAMYQVHPWGTDWLIASDGLFYAGMFDVKVDDAKRYFQRLRRLRSRLNLSGTVSIIDLAEIVEHYAHGCGELYERHRSQITHHLLEIAGSHREDLHSAFNALKRGMRQNQSTRMYDRELSPEDLWMACMWSGSDRIGSSKGRAAHGHFDKRAHDIAISYACENLLLRLHRVLDKVFPENLRTTVHPKPGQIAVPQVGSCFPWNGVSVLKSPNIANMEQLEVKRFTDIGRRHESVVAYKDAESGATLFFSPE